VEAPGGNLRVGDSIRLSVGVGETPAGAIGRVIGFLRRDPELLVIAVPGGLVLHVRPDDVTKHTGDGDRAEADPPAAQS
jgi:hypothetical protein